MSPTFYQYYFNWYFNIFKQRQWKNYHGLPLHNWETTSKQFITQLLPVSKLKEANNVIETVRAENKQTKRYLVFVAHADKDIFFPTISAEINNLSFRKDSPPDNDTQTLTRGAKC